MKLSYKLGAFCALVTALSSGLISAFALSAFTSYTYTQASEQLKKDARVAASVYEKRLDKMRAAAHQLAVEIANKALVSSEAAARDSSAAWARMQDLLPRAQNDFNLDFLLIADTSGRVIARHNDRPAADELVTGAAGSKAQNRLAERVINEGFQQHGVALAAAVVEAAETLQRLGLDGVAQVRVGDEVKVREALMIEAGAPIFSGGRFIGIVLIGQMLNNFYVTRAGAAALQTPLVAEVKQVLAHAGQGTSGAVIALQDVIIASSLTPVAEKPALLGSRCNPHQDVEEINENRHTYLLSWQPIAAIDGAPIGTIGVALDAAGVGDAGTALTVTLLVIGLLAALFAGTAGFLFGRQLAARVTALNEAAARMSVGELSAPIRDGTVSEGRPFGNFFVDELNQLTDQLDDLRESFRQAIERLRKR